MIREEIRDSIFYNPEYFDGCDYDIYFNYDQAYNSFPCVFPTIWCPLYSTIGLNSLADKMRKEDGELPFFDESGEYDDDGWYDFFIDLNGYTGTHVANCIYARAYDQEEYCIDLSEEEQEYVYQVLEKDAHIEEWLEECKQYYADYGVNLTICERRTA